MSKTILFKNGSNFKSTSFGQMVEISIYCYIRGLELGYDDIYIEWQNIRTLWDDYGRCISGFKLPKDDELPFSYVTNDTDKEFDKVIDISERDIFYDGSEPVITDNGCKIKSIQTYIKDYIDRKGTPYIKLRHNDKQRYILINYRHSSKSKQQFRNVDEIWYLKLIRYIKRNYNISVYKTGESSRIDSLCDKVFGYSTENPSEMYSLMNDCIMYIGSPAGPWILSIFLNKPSLLMVRDKYIYDLEKSGMCGVLNNNQSLIITDKNNYKEMLKFIDNVMR